MGKNCLILLVFMGLFGCSNESFNEEREVSILVIGNSITEIGANPEKGWLGNWGMAASSPSKDFCGIIQKQVKNCTLDRKNIAVWERDFDYPLANVNSKSYDYLIIKLGENVDRNNVEFKNAFNKMIKHFKDKKTKVIVVSTVWKEYEGNSEVESKRDFAMKSVAIDNGYEYVDLKDMVNSSEYFAWGEYEDTEVACHPNDLGMRFIADKILENL